MIFYDFFDPGRFGSQWQKLAFPQQFSHIRINHLVVPHFVDQSGINPLSTADIAKKHVKLIGVESGSHHIGLCVDQLLGRYGEVRLVSKSQVDVADIVISVQRHKGFKPSLPAVVLAVEIGKGAGITDLYALLVKKAHVDKGIARLSQIPQAAIHIRFRWGETEFSAVKKAEDVDHPFLEKKIDGVLLALGQGGQMEFSGFFQSGVELKVKIYRQRGKRCEKGCQQPEFKAQPELLIERLSAIK